jgi:DNA-binding XRE family transcriptional regulator
MKMSKAARKGEITIGPEAIGLLKAGRNALHWSQDDLACKSGISSATVKRIEAAVTQIHKDAIEHMGLEYRGTNIRTESIRMLLCALEKHGVSFWNEGTEVGISMKSKSDEHEFFDVVRSIPEK